MRNVTFLAAGLGLLLVQANLFRAFDGIHGKAALVLWVAAVLADIAQGVQAWRVPGHARAIATFRADFTLPATVLLGYASLGGVAHIGRPVPSLVLPLVLFMGVHDYSLPRGTAVAFVLGYATDVVGIAPVGLYTFTYVATFLLARVAGVRLAAQTAWLQVVLVGAFAALQSIMILVLLAIFGRDPWVPRSLYPLSIPHAIATASVGPVVFRWAQRLHATTGGPARVAPDRSELT